MSGTYLSLSDLQCCPGFPIATWVLSIDSIFWDLLHYLCVVVSQCSGVHDIHQWPHSSTLAYREPSLCQRTRLVWGRHTHLGCSLSYTYIPHTIPPTFTNSTLAPIGVSETDCVCVPSEYLCHVYVRNDSLGAVVIADGEYPSRVCFTLLDKVGEYPSRAGVSRFF